MQTPYDFMKINNEPTITYSEDVYKSLLEAHNLMDESSDYEDEDPLALNFSNINHDENSKICDEESVESQVCINNSEAIQDEQLPHDPDENQTELITIQIVENEAQLSTEEKTSNASCLQQTENIVPPSTSKDFFVVEMSSEDINSILSTYPIDSCATNTHTQPAKSAVNGKLSKQQTQKFIEQNTQSPLVKIDLSYSIGYHTELPLSCKEFSAMELNFKYDYDHSFNSDPRIFLPGEITREILDICEKCMENTLYMENIHNVKNIRSKIVLVLMKLKRNLSFRELATELNLQEHICKVIFYSAINIFSVSLEPAIYWFTKTELTRSRSQHLNLYNSNNVRVILHELAFNVIECRKSQCNVLLCGQYKKHKSVKVIIGLSPTAGLFSYVSNPYDYSTSTEAVLKNEKVFSHLCQCDTVVLTHSFGTAISMSLTGEFRTRGIKLQLINKVKPEVQKYADVILLKLKEFKILRSPGIRSHMVPLLGKVVCVICGVLNLKSEAENN